MKSRLSLITVCYNAEKTIKKTFESILEQAAYCYEYIIVDGLSNDTTNSIIKDHLIAFENKNIIVKYTSENDLGVYDAMNKGIQMVSGDIVGIVNADDYLEPNALKTVHDYFSSNDDIEILHGSMNFIQNSKTLTLKKKKVNKPFKQMSVYHPSTFVKKTVYEKVGLYNINWKIAADYDFILRAEKNNVKFHQIDKTLSNMLSGGISNEILKAQNEFRKVSISHGCSNVLANYYYLRSLIRLSILKILKL